MSDLFDDKKRAWENGFRTTIEILEDFASNLAAAKLIAGNFSPNPNIDSRELYAMYYDFQRGLIGTEKYSPAVRLSESASKALREFEKQLEITIPDEPGTPDSIVVGSLEWSRLQQFATSAINELRKMATEAIGSETPEAI